MVFVFVAPMPQRENPCRIRHFDLILQEDLLPLFRYMCAMVCAHCVIRLKRAIPKHWLIGVGFRFIRAVRAKSQPLFRLHGSVRALLTLTCKSVLKLKLESKLSLY